MREPDREDFAGEIWSACPPSTPRVVLAAIVRAFWIGVVAGSIPSSAVLLLYYLEHHDLPLPWGSLVSNLALFAVVTGTALAVSIQVLILGFGRIARLGFGLVVLFNPITAGVVGGALAGIGPGAFAIAKFGSYEGPIVDSWTVTLAIIAGAGLIALPLARPSPLRGLAAAALVGGAALAVVVIAVLPFLDEEDVRITVRAMGPRPVGAAVGAIGGGAIGLFTGVVIAVSRALVTDSRGTRPGRRSGPR